MFTSSLSMYLLSMSHSIVSLTNFFDGKNMFFNSSINSLCSWASVTLLRIFNILTIASYWKKKQNKKIKGRLKLIFFLFFLQLVRVLQVRVVTLFPHRLIDKCEQQQKKNCNYFGSFSSQKHYFLIFFFAILLSGKLKSSDQVQLASVLWLVVSSILNTVFLIKWGFENK